MGSASAARTRWRCSKRIGPEALVNRARLGAPRVREGNLDLRVVVLVSFGSLLLFALLTLLERYAVGERQDERLLVWIQAHSPAWLYWLGRDVFNPLGSFET